MNTLPLPMLGAVAEFERSMILGRRRKGIAIVKAAGKYKGRKAALPLDQGRELGGRQSSGAGCVPGGLLTQWIAPAGSGR